MLNYLISLGWGTLSLSREKAEKIVDYLIKKGDIGREDARQAIKELVERGEEERAKFKEYLNGEISNLLQKGNIATKADLNKLEEKIKYLEEAWKKVENKEGQEGL